MKAEEIRSRFLSFFEKKGHAIEESSSLVPQNDPTLLFTNAGMVQFKDVFLGKEKRPYTRATTSQKCVRAGGKHNDLERVGFTARHHTFFEMLGNFSFGDYFKKEAIAYAWEFVTKELALPKDKLYVTVFREDDEAALIWEKEQGVSKDHIFRLDEKDNFWSMGETGPCGPCSEIYIDRGEKYGCGSKTCQVGCDCDRFMEFWNLVFMQFDKDQSGKLNPLPKPSVDTGAGLERIASILQKVETNYETDIFLDIIEKTAKLAGIKYNSAEEKNTSFRVIADHARATTFLIGDGVMPANEGRGYVLRRIIRRAIRHGKKIGFEAPFLNQVCGFVIDQMKSAYPDLKDKRAFIEKAVTAEEEQFFRTLERGLKLLDEEISKLGKSKILPGKVAFTLYDTFGFPLDLTRVICEENKLSVDEAGFEECMKIQKSESKKNWKGSGEEAIDEIYHSIFEELKTKNQIPEFLGFEQLTLDSTCVALIKVNEDDSLEKCDSASQGSNKKVQAVFLKTPFYAEGGGQMADKGLVFDKNEFKAKVTNVTKPVGNLVVLHLEILQGNIKIKSNYTQSVDSELRGLTAKNHTATHLLHWALRSVLGTHVKQAGSLVNSELLRFDFTHFEPMTEDETNRTETLINEKIWGMNPVKKVLMSKDKALEAGAIAFFGEKYGDEVRVVSVGDFSTELCGGAHVDFSSDIHLFKIVNENGIAAGVRRIIAYTSKGAFEYLKEKDVEIKKLKSYLKASATSEILTKIEKLTQTEKELRKKIDQLEIKNASGELEEAIANGISSGDALIITHLCNPNESGIKFLREFSDRIKQKNESSVAILGMKNPDNGNPLLLVSIGKKVQNKFKANEILKELLHHINGKGGGKPDLAQASGTNFNGLQMALDAAKKIGPTA